MVGHVERERLVSRLGMQARKERGDLGDRRTIAIGGDDPRALAGKGQGRGAADACPRRREECGFSL